MPLCSRSFGEFRRLWNPIFGYFLIFFSHAFTGQNALRSEVSAINDIQDYNTTGKKTAPEPINGPRGRH
jgi:hypothetical protein